MVEMARGPRTGPRIAGAIEARGVIRIHESPGGAVPAARGLDLDVRAGEIAAIAGPSGSGKSSVLRLLSGLDRPSAGTLRVLGLDLGRASQRQLDGFRRDHVALVEQHYWRALSPYRSIQATVELPLAIRGQGARARRARAQGLLERVGLGDRLDAVPGELSGGEQQRVAIASALAVRPAILLADEPTGELDDGTASHLLDTLAEVVRDEGATCVIVTHDSMVEQFADRVVYLQDGRIVAEQVDGERRRSVDSLGWLAPSLRGAPAPVEAAGPASGAAVIRLDEVSRSFVHGGSRDLGLRRVSASIARGGYHVVTGPSGTGKTTLLRMIAGLDRPTTGRIETLGQDLAALDREALSRLRAERIGLVDQMRTLVPFLTAIENVELGLVVRGRRPGPGDTAAADALDRLGILPLADRRPDELSAGERLRVAIARALACGPELLLLDEPTSALDRANAVHVARLLADLAVDGTTVVAATHDAVLISAATDRLDLRGEPVAAVDETESYHVMGDAG